MVDPEFFIQLLHVDLSGLGTARRSEGQITVSRQTIHRGIAGRRIDQTSTSSVSRIHRFR